MWADQDLAGTEGLKQIYSFTGGVEYSLSFRMKTTSSQGSFRIALANGVPTEQAGRCGGTNIPNVPDKQIIYDNTIQNQNWMTESVTFKANKNYTQIWIHSYINGPLGTQWTNLDDLELENLDCFDQVVYQNTNTLPSITQSRTFIEARTNVRVESNQSVIFDAAQKVQLFPGFHAKQGSNFTAKIEGCADGPFVQIDQSLSNPISLESEATLDSLSNAVENSLFRIYPNPSSGMVSIDLYDYPFNHLEILDIVGKRVYFIDKPINRQKLSLNLSHLPNDIYFLKINSGNSVIVQKFLLSK